MESIKTFIREHQKGAIILLFMLIVFIGCSAVSAINVAKHRAEEAAVQTDEVRDKGNASDNTDTPLSKEQKEAISNYDDETKNFIDTLSASVWSAGGGRYSLRFSRDSYTESVNGESNTHSYAITRMEKTGDGYGGTYRTIVFDTDTGTHIVTYADGKGSAVQDVSGNIDKDDSSVISTIKSTSMFAQKDTPYERVETVEDISIKGLNSEITTLLDDSTDKLIEELSTWCAVHYPSATEPTWEKTAVIDYETGVVSTNFTLNTENPVSIAITYSLSDKSYDFEL